MNPAFKRPPVPKRGPARAYAFLLGQVVQIAVRSARFDVRVISVSDSYGRVRITWEPVAGAGTGSSEPENLIIPDGLLD